MSEEKPQHNLECDTDSHTEHLCYLMSQSFHLTEEQDYKALIEDPKFRCRRCGRKAGSKKNLCMPAGL
jgi:hypothetical protein